ncbi:MAG: RelA/SpoT domain-containing protein [Gallionella sp.]|jgi:ppGpp synthetase/RelA/SpoT-type nucleotidyltranferase
MSTTKTTVEKPLTPSKRQLNQLIATYENRRDEVDLFRRQVADFFLVTKRFNTGILPLVHSVKSRLKDTDHLRDKIIRKWKDGPITPETLFSRITDFAGVRVIHLYSQQFRDIHSAIVEHVAQGYWYLNEPPVAYSWDPEATAFFTKLGLNAQTRDSYYTSIHYVVKPQRATDLACEIQVRTLFEEAWGEIDHALNYPHPTDVLACNEQIRVLAKLASTGTRLADSIFATAHHAGKRFTTEG